MLDAIKKTLHLVALFIQLAIIGSWLFARLPTRNHRLRLNTSDLFHKIIAVIAFIAQHGFYRSALLVGESTVLEQQLGLRDLVALPWHYCEDQWIAEGIAYDVDFARETTATTA